MKSGGVDGVFPGLHPGYQHLHNDDDKKAAHWERPSFIAQDVQRNGWPFISGMRIYTTRLTALTATR